MPITSSSSNHLSCPGFTTQKQVFSNICFLRLLKRTKKRDKQDLQKLPKKQQKNNKDYKNLQNRKYGRVLLNLNKNIVSLKKKEKHKKSKQNKKKNVLQSLNNNVKIY